MNPIAKSANHESEVVRSKACATRKLTTMPDAPTIANLRNWRTPRLRNPIPIREEYGEEAQKRQREREDNVVHPRTVAPTRQNGEHREEHQGKARHRHEIRGRHRN